MVLVVGLVAAILVASLISVGVSSLVIVGQKGDKGDTGATGATEQLALQDPKAFKVLQE